MKALALSILSAFLLSCTGPQQGDGQAKTMTATEYKNQHDKNQEAVLVDVRTPAEFEAGHVEQAQNTDFLSGEFEKKMQHWDKDKTYYLYCASGNRSGKAAKLMEEAGFRKVYNIGAYKDLKGAGLPVQE
ncbi:rhodanese-like domain-containing protein [Pontibacter roseus]|uniref:rhodanese-like domain-containing protein n=1 Tax=Pontibacter roseus TaxID=336989 RepID=UPI0003752D5E|nr:rhodanese-like domain-containing protein [Pontibacter roseus]